MSVETGLVIDSAPAPASEPAAVAAPSPAAADDLRERVIAALGTIFDPEIPVSIWELGLVYRVDISADHAVDVDMTLTAPACPVAGEMPGQVEAKLNEVEGVSSAKVTLVWEPAWDRSMMSPDAQLAMGFGF